MITISFIQMLVFITAAWLAARGFFALRSGRIEWRRELMLLAVYICLAVIARMVYFPMARIGGRIAPLRFDPVKMPGPVNLVPIVGLSEKYDGWMINLIGNIAMFIPVGILWPLVFKRLNGIGKATLAGFALSLFIELTQLLFYERTSDVNDLILNTMGAFIGAACYFAVKAIINIRRKA